MTEPEMRTYEMLMTDGRRQRFTVPATYKVSFGAIVPASAKASAQGYGGYGWGVRVWESAEKQRAVFSGVAEFRDLSIPLTVAAVRLFGAPDDEWALDDGTWTGKRADLVEKAWKPIEEVKEYAPETAAR